MPSLIKPNYLIQLRLYRLTNKKECHRGLQYTDGLVVNPESFNPSGSCTGGGMFFFDETQLCNYQIHTQDIHWIRSVALLPDSQVWKEKDKYKTDKFILGRRQRFSPADLPKYVDFGLLSITQLNKALIWSSRKGYTRVVQALLGKGYPHANPHRERALYEASKMGNTEVVKLLLEEGVNVHAEEDVALCIASKYGHIEVVEILLKAGANVHARKDQAYLDQPLQLALDWKHKDVELLLLKEGASIKDGIIKKLWKRFRK